MLKDFLVWIDHNLGPEGPLVLYVSIDIYIYIYICSCVSRTPGRSFSCTFYVYGRHVLSVKMMVMAPFPGLFIDLAIYLFFLCSTLCAMPI